MSTSAPPVQSVAPAPRQADPLQLFGGVLAPHMPALEDRIAALSDGMPALDADWVRDQRAQLGAPFDRLGRLLDRWNATQLEHASRRVATASVLASASARRDGAAAQQVAEAGRARADEMLGHYERMAGGDWAERIRHRARALYGFAQERGEAWASQQAAGELKPWFVARSRLDQAVATWFEQHGEAAARDIVLRRAEQQLALAIDQPQSEVEILAPRAPEASALDQEAADRYRPLLGRELAEHLDERAAALRGSHEQLPTEQLRAEHQEIDQRLEPAYAAALAEADKLVAERNGLMNSMNASRRQAASLDQAAKELRDKTDRDKLQAEASGLRRTADNARKVVRRRDEALDKLRQGWFGEYGEDAALEQALARELHDRAQDRTTSIEQPRDERGQATSEPIGSDVASLREAFEANQYLLGARRAAEITAGAQFLREQIKGAESTELTARLGELDDPFATLDKAEALATLARERERRMIFGDLQARLAGVEAGNTGDRASVERHRAQLAQHDQGEAQRSREDPRHPEAWMRGPAAAQLQEGLAIEAELHARGIEIAADTAPARTGVDLPARAQVGVEAGIGAGR